MSTRTDRFPYGTPAFRAAIDPKALALPMFIQGGVSHQRRPILLTEHCHQGYEIHVIVSGRSTQLSAHGDRLSGRGGSVMLMQPGVLHHGEHDIIPKSHLAWLVFDPSQKGADKNTALTRADCLSLDRELAKMGNRCVKASAHTLTMTQRLEDLLRTQPQRGPQLRSTLVELVLSCQDDLSQSTARSSSLPVPIAQALRFLATRQGEVVPIPDLAAQVNLSASRFYQLFKEHIGMTPSDYHLRNRISHAQQLLRCPDTSSIALIAKQTGFSSGRHFATVFKSFTGSSPSTWRDSVKAGG